MNPVDAHGSGPTQLNDKRGPSREDSFDDEDNGTRNDTGDVLAMELRNPSDALQIGAFGGSAPSASIDKSKPCNGNCGAKQYGWLF